MLRAVIPVTLVICGSIILQYHAIPYWRESFGFYVGTGSSIFVEAVGLWAWILKGKTAVLIGLCAGALTLIPSCYQKYDALIHSGQQATIYNGSVQLIKDEIKEHQEKINVFLRNSEKRSGWSGFIKEEGRALNQLREELNDKLSKPVKQPNTTESTFAITLQIMMLIFAFSSNIFALRKLREQFVAPEMRRNVQRQSEDNIGHPFKELQEKVILYMKENNLSTTTEAAKKIGVDRHNLSYLIKCIKDGDRKPKKEVVQQLQNFFESAN